MMIKIIGEKRTGQHGVRRFMVRRIAMVLSSCCLVATTGCESPKLLDVPEGDFWSVYASVVDQETNRVHRPDLDDPEFLLDAWVEALEFNDLVTLPRGEDIMPEAFLDGNTPYTGWAKTTYQNGQLNLLYYHKLGKVAGTGGKWYPSGKKEIQIHCENGKLHGPYTRWYENGGQRTEGSHKNNKRDGIWIDWYSDGQKSRVVRFREGKLSGSVSVWHKNGEKSLTGQFDENELCGAWELFFENGRRSAKGNCKNGEPVGVWIFYGEDGKIKKRITFHHSKSNPYSPLLRA